MPTEPITDEAAELLCSLIEANHVESTWISNQLIVAYKAELDATRALLSAALASIPHGGTTAEYERGLARVEAALHPSPQVMDVYRRRAEQFLAGVPEDAEPALWSDNGEFLDL